MTPGAMTPRVPNPRGGGRVGVREVAQLAGVSTQTVSRVLNGSTSVREDTRHRVLDAMAQLDYRPNNAARSLGTARTRILGVVATDITLFGPSAAIAALAGAARERGRWLSTAYAEADDEESVDSAVSHVLGQGVDGIVLVAPHARTRDSLLGRALDVPIVIMHGGPYDRQSEGESLVVEHLVELSHRRIGRLGGPPDWIEESSRRVGFEASLAVHGLRPGPSWVGDWSAEAGAAAAAEIVAATRSPEGPTAIVVANDQMALGLMTSLRAHGVDVPRDLSVVGFDDNPDAAHYQPALTTVRLDLAGEARRCVAAVFGGDGSEEPGPPELVLRSSTRPPS
jgi:DNA-binding LacI/PurR family transcriptional regulator